MGGHGALTLYLKSILSSSSATAATKYLSASAFAPIANPTQCPWGEKAFGGYLNGGVEEGKEYDATELIKQAKGKDLKILIDVGTGDNFYKQKQRELAPGWSAVLSLLFDSTPLPTVLTETAPPPLPPSLRPPPVLRTCVRGKTLQFPVLPENFIAARDAAGFSDKDVSVSLHEHYDHSYYFISTFAPGECPVPETFLLRLLESPPPAKAESD